jgi:hypothetical protein
VRSACRYPESLSLPRLAATIGNVPEIDWAALACNFEDRP